jgi:hypothetical protein
LTVIPMVSPALWAELARAVVSTLATVAVSSVRASSDSNSGLRRKDGRRGRFRRLPCFRTEFLPNCQRIPYGSCLITSSNKDQRCGSQMVPRRVRAVETQLFMIIDVSVRFQLSAQSCQVFMAIELGERSPDCPAGAFTGCAAIRWPTFGRRHS